MSTVPELYYFVEENAVDDFTRSTACCYIEKHGETDFYFDDENVKVFGMLS